MLSCSRHIRRIHVFGDSCEVELVLVAFSMDFVNDFLVVVVTNGTTKFVVVHARLAFTDTP